MRNIIGQVPTGDDFYVRHKLLNRLYDRLNDGSDIFLAAPRRMGKSAIMFHLEEKPRPPYSAVYIYTEAIDSIPDFFERLLDELFESEAIRSIKKVSDTASRIISNIFSRFKKLSAAGFSIEMSQADSNQENFFEQLLSLVRELDGTEGRKVLIMIDEFPQTIRNIHKKSGRDEALKFLRLTREIRHHANNNVQFILTGSIGLRTLVGQINAITLIDDLETFEVDPLSREEAKDMTVKLLRAKNVPFKPEAIDYMLDQIQWFCPYFIQLMVRDFVEEALYNDHAVNKNSVDYALENITDRRNRTYYGSYYERLKETFTANEQDFAFELLKELATNPSMKKNELKKLAQKYKLSEDTWHFVLDTLEFDGYIYLTKTIEGKNEYRFVSPVLQRWWRKYVYRQ